MENTAITPRLSSRRLFLRQGALALGAAALVPRVARAAFEPEKRLRLYHLHTHERVDVLFKRGGEYVPEGLAELNHHLRDHRKNEIHPYDPSEYDLLADLLDQVGRPKGEYHIICGYRTPATNEMLRDTRGGVAQKSLHMQAKAIDLRLPGTKTAVLRDAALSMKRGGVGYYEGQDFIHVDTGRVRRW
jgi:uncharacterized protein YcbK (DUF882 family)